MRNGTERCRSSDQGICERIVDGHLQLLLNHFQIKHSRTEAARSVVRWVALEFGVKLDVTDYVALSCIASTSRVGKTQSLCILAETE